MSGPGTEKAPSPTAARQAREAYPDSKGFQRAFVKGWYGRLAGRQVAANPYRGRLIGRHGRVHGTFTFAWRAAWERGWRAADTTTGRRRA